MTDLWPSLHARKPDKYDDYLETLTNDEAMQLALMEDQAKDGHCCPTCDDSGKLETIGSEIICQRCGTIVDIPLEMGAEYRWFSNDTHSGSGGADPSRCSFPINPLMPESSLGTMILSRAGSGSATMRKIKQYHLYNLNPYRERTLWTIFESLQVRASNAGISTAIVEEAKELFAQLTAHTSCRGQGQRDTMLAVCLWESLKRHGTPRTPKDIAAVFNITQQSVTKGIKQFQQNFAIRLMSEDTSTYTNPVIKPKVMEKPKVDEAKKGEEKKKEEENGTVASTDKETKESMVARAKHRQALLKQTLTRTTTYEDFITPFLTNLSLPNSATVEYMVRAICARIEDMGVVPENTPPSLTASVIAFTCSELGITLDFNDLSRVCGVSSVTIQKCLKRMSPWKAKLLENLS